MSEAQHSTDHLVDLTSSQLLMWTGQQLQPGEPLYNMALTFRVEGAIDPEIFNRAFNALVACCDSLRSIIDTSGETPRQRFLHRFDYDLKVVDFTNETDPESMLNAWISDRRTRSFDLSQCHFESSLIKLGDLRFVWYLNQHHVLTDAWSVGVSFRKMSELYGLARRNRLDEAQEIPRFEAYVEHEQAERNASRYDKARAYWQENLKRPLSPSRFYRQVPTGRTGRTVRLPCPLGGVRSSRIKALASTKPFRSFSPDLSLFQIFCTALFAYLYRITDHHALAIGTPSHNRSSATWRETSGLFIEIFPMLIEVEPEETFVSLYKKVQRTAHKLFLNAPSGASGFEHNRAYDVLLNYITASFGDFDGLTMESEWVHAGFGDRNHLLRLQVHDFDRADEFQLFFDLNEEAFVGVERQWAVEHYLELLDGFVEDPECRIAEITLLKPGEPYPLTAISDACRATAPAFGTVVEAFERQVRKMPDEVATVSADDVLTYRELNARANRLAYELSRRAIGAGAVVGVLIDRSMAAVTSIIGILKSGAVFLPLDPDYPEYRIACMLDDAGVALVVTCDEWRDRIAARGAETLAVGGDFWDSLQDDVAHPSPPAPDELAYIIYTSGSTGQPKGVMVTHGNAANYVGWAANTYLDGEALSFPLFSSLAFDLTITSVFVPLVSGGRIVVYPHTTGLREISIHKIIEDNEVDIIKLTPSHLLLMQSMDLVGSRVKKLILGGEDLRTDIARTITRRFGGDVEIYNEYGPTEATVGCMIYRFDPARDTDISVPIGRAIDNLRVYVLDDYAHPQPQGVAGEIFIGGAGLSRGYLNREDVTHEKFVDDPFKPGELMYATGDLARWNAGGQMEYLGRKDEQIKIRGVRIELGEVETALLEHEAVGSCVVDLLVRNDALQDEDYCTQCGLSARHPDAHLDDEGVCRICRIHADVGVEADVYFRDLADLKPVLANARKSSAGKQDCMMLLSGGKDSTYALCRLVDLGFTPLVFTLDNGFISDGAKENIRCVVDQLGLELVIGTTSAMNAIFVDSLNRFSNVCNGCFKTIYTLSMNIAHERGIKHIMTGLSRGQIFETRIAGLFQQRIFDPHEIDRNVIEARKAYHRMDDAVSRSLDVSIFQNDDIFDEIEFIDFYRYCDTTLDDIYAYLAERVPWVRPRDTGRSTNCRINELGIFVHTRERGFHNYALPYSWDVRLGHKERDAALKELDDDIDVDNVRSILDEIGYRTEEAPSSIETDKFLAAYFCTNDAIDAADLRIFLSTRLPAEFIPRHFIEIEEIPLTSNGKVDRAALPHPDRSRPELTVAYVPPRSDIEKKLSSVWSNVLGVDRIGVDDNFFEFGGDSILNIQIVARARKLGVGITPQQIFDHPTIAELAQVTDTVDVSVREQGPVEGPVPLTPMQRRFFERCDRQTLGQVQAVLLTLSDDVDIALLEAAVGFLRSHHDALRARYYDAGGEWHQQLTPVTEARIVAERIDLSSMSATEQERALNRFLVEANLSLDIGAGRLIHMACFERGGSGDRTVAIVVHRLVIDSVSWWILIEDLEAAYEHLARGDEIKLPLKTSSVKRWSQALSDYALSDTPHREAAYWSALTSESGHIPLDFTDRGPNDRSTVRTVSQALAAADTKALLNEVPTAYRVQIPELIITAVAESIVAWSGTPDCLIDVEGHGREEIANNIDLLRTVGWISTMYPVALRLESDDPDSHLKAVKERLRAVPNLGIGYGVLRYLSHQDDIVEIPVKIEAAPVSFNYLGQWEHAMSGSSGLHIAQPIIDLPGNVGPRAHVIDIDATVFDGELRMNWHYSSNYHQRSTIEGLASSCIAALQALIGYCLAHAGGGLSPSDFPSADRDQEALDELLADFGDTTK